jgi:hypothetical protein
LAGDCCWGIDISDSEALLRFADRSYKLYEASSASHCSSIIRAHTQSRYYNRHSHPIATPIGVACGSSDSDSSCMIYNSSSSGSLDNSSSCTSYDSSPSNWSSDNSSSCTSYDSSPSSGVQTTAVVALAMTAAVVGVQTTAAVALATTAAVAAALGGSSSGGSGAGGDW